MILLTLLSTIAFSQTAQIKDIPVTETTVISVKKGETAKEKAYEIVEGEDEIAGEPQLTIKEARLSWNKQCKEWKEEIKELNKTNVVMHINCGKMACVKETTDHACTSQGKYKVKTKMTE